MIFVFVEFTLLSMVISKFIHVGVVAIILFFLKAEQYFILYMYHSFFIFSSFNGHLCSFHVLAIVNSGVMNSWVHASFATMFFFIYMCRSGIIGSYVSSIFSFIRNFSTIFHSGSTNLHAHHLFKRIFF